MQPLARIFVESASHNLGAFRIDDFRVVPTHGLEYQPCDLAVIYGLPNPLLDRARSRLRTDVFAKHAGPVLVVESAIIGRIFLPPKGQFGRWLLGRYRKPQQINPYMRLAVGGAFGPEADFNNIDCPPDRWERLGLSISPYRTTGDHVVLIGQTPNDASLRGLNMTTWIGETAETIRKHTDRPIHVRLHPGMGWREAEQIAMIVTRVPGTFVSPRDRSLHEDLAGAWASISLSSGAAVESMIAGIPAITLSADSLAYSVTSHDLSDIEDPPLTAREQWLYDLAYAQWTEKEYQDGTAWRHIAPAVHRAFEAGSKIS